MKILVIQQKMIGDVLVSGLLCRHLRENLENPEIHFLANTGTEAVLEGNPYIDAIVFFTPQYRRSKRAFLRFLLDIRRRRYDVVIDVYGKIESQLITIFSGAAVRIAKRKWYSRFFYSHTVERINNEKVREGMAIEDRLRLLSPLISSLKNPESLPEIYLTKEEREAAAGALREHGIDPGKPLLMVGLLGSAPSKTYPLEFMAVLLEQVIVKFPETTLLLNYMPKQKSEAEKLLAYLSEPARKRIRSDIYSSGLRSFLANLAHCDAVLSNEGGAVNMAKALGVPTYSIYSPWIRKEAWDTHKADPRHQAVHLRDFKPVLFENKDKKEFRKASPEYYMYFRPDLFAQDMLSFLKNYLR